MGWVLRRSEDRVNPTLPGGVYGLYITAGRGVYYRFDGARTRFAIFISDGGRYGMNNPTKITYKSVNIPTTDYKFHPGLPTKQITPFVVTATHGTNKINHAGHPYNNGDAVRLNAPGGTLPVPIPTTKVWVINKSTNDYELSSTDPATETTPIDLTDNGTGTIYVWKADAGWDDPVQGLPTYVPEVETTFSSICYVEGLLPAQYNTSDEPDWQDFRIEGVGRILMNYDSTGAELGTTTDPELCRNPALCDADDIVVEMKRPLSRIDWASWADFKADCAVDMTQQPNFEEDGTGFRAKYYNLTGGVPPDIATQGELVLERVDSQINFYYTAGSSPAPGVNEVHATVWEAQLKFPYTETITFTFTRDNGMRFYINNVLLIDQWTNDTNVNFTTTYAATANVPFTVRLEYFNGGGPGSISMAWSSPSRPQQIVPKSAAYEPNASINRYECNVAFASPTEASAVHEAIMTRCPGWHWTDINGKITYLPPDRPTTFDFVYDGFDRTVESTFLEKTFTKSRRHRRERRNFALYSYRNQNLSGYPENFVEQNRPRLRELGGGVPNNDPPQELMVMSRSQAERVAAFDFAVSTDPAYELELSAQRPSGKVTKAQLVTVKNWVEGDLRVETSTAVVKTIGRRGNRLDFTMLPIDPQALLDGQGA